MVIPLHPDAFRTVKNSRASKTAITSNPDVYRYGGFQADIGNDNHIIFQYVPLTKYCPFYDYASVNSAVE